MSYIKKKEDRLLNVYFLKDTFVVEGINNSIDDVIEKWIKAFEVDKYETLYKLGFVKKEIWFSICSRHAIYDENCNMCNTGSWQNTIKYKVSSLIYDLFPSLWRWWVNR